jgi:hypothetical protein
MVSVSAYVICVILTGLDTRHGLIFWSASLGALVVLIGIGITSTRQLEGMKSLRASKHGSRLFADGIMVRGAIGSLVIVVVLLTWFGLVSDFAMIVSVVGAMLLFQVWYEIQLVMRISHASR